MKYVKPSTLFNDLIKGKLLEDWRLLGLDVGEKYIGLAVSDHQNRIASPLCVFNRRKRNIDLLAADFQSVTSEVRLLGFVVGNPLDRQSRCAEAFQGKIFIDHLSATGKLEGLKYTYWDECFTSKNVELLVKPLNLHPFLEKNIVDKFAAMGILQGYLDHFNRNMKADARNCVR